MKIILMQNLKGVGQIGEVKNVADGYGLNFLIARGLAKVATDSSVKEAETLRRKAEMLEKIEENRAKELVGNIKDMVVEIKRKASDKGTLFEGVEAMDIAETLKNKISFDIGKDMIKLKEPIKHIGKHTVEIELTSEVKTQIVIEIVKSE